MSRVTYIELASEARRIIERTAQVPTDGASVIALTGDLGAGKTELTRAIATELGVRDPVPSPTFVIEQIYDLAPEQSWDRLVHIDAYRLESGEELTPLGWQEQVADSGNLTIVEWAEKVKGSIPERAIWIEMEVVGEEEREIRMMNTE